MRVKPPPGHYRIVFGMPGIVLYLHITEDGAEIVIEPIHYQWVWEEGEHGPYLSPVPDNPDQAVYGFAEGGVAILVHGGKEAVGGYARI